jgi:methionine synthase II (cobalamin-independent)
MNRMGAICAPVPSDVELGFHLCYGDFGAKHFLEPRDAGRMVDVCNALAKTVSHPIAYIHMPVPMTRNDDAYFRPFESLRLSPETEIYLGLIHLADGVEGARQRIATARKFVNEFGVGTECGIARARTSQFVENVLQVYAQTAREPAP